MGFPSPAKDYMEEPLDLNAELNPRPSSTYLFAAKGSNLTEFCVPKKATFIVDRSIKVKKNDLVVVNVDGEIKAGIITKVDGKPCIIANENTKPVFLNEFTSMQGVVTFVIFNPRDL